MPLFSLRLIMNWKRGPQNGAGKRRLFLIRPRRIFAPEIGTLRHIRTPFGALRSKTSCGKVSRGWRAPRRSFHWRRKRCTHFVDAGERLSAGRGGCSGP